jgi:hypothetical protein
MLIRSFVILILFFTCRTIKAQNTYNPLPELLEQKVIVRYIVNEDSTIGNIEIVKGLDSKRDSEAVKFISSLPKMKPPKYNGKYVKTYFTQPVKFCYK